jgi:two-component system, LytTR family, response regulator
METTGVCEGEKGVISARPKVLIVEDECIVAENIRQDLESLGYQIIGITGSGRNAIEIAEKISPDVVLMDIHIKADLNGIETAVCLQGLYEQPIPVVFVTGFWKEQHSLFAAVNPYILVKKPFSTKELSSSIRKVMLS